MIGSWPGSSLPTTNSRLNANAPAATISRGIHRGRSRGPHRRSTEPPRSLLVPAASAQTTGVGSENFIHWVSIAGKSEHDCWMFAIAFLFVRVLCDLYVLET